MNLQLLKTNIVTVKLNIESLVSTTNPQYEEELQSFIILLEKLQRFLKDAQNIEVLEKYEIKSGDDKDDCPLDILCKDVLDKLVAVEALLASMELDCKHSQNQPPDQRYLYIRHAGDKFIKIKNILTDLTAHNLLSVFEILKHLDGHNKTLIILGPNGSGKTSFANFLKRNERHVKVIPACKPIKEKGYLPSMYSSKLSDVKNELFNNSEDLKEDLLQKLIVGICNEHDNAARKYYDTGKKEDTAFGKIKRIFDDFFDVKLDNSNFGSKQMCAKKEEKVFSFNSMSDGERVAFFYIATVLVAPPQSFIIVDEPENHLNPAIYNKIWDKLINERNDCQFIFISHTMEFINARSNYELVKMKNFVYPDKFEFEFLGSSLEDIDMGFVVEIVGSRKPILFCEGSKNDYDYKIYESLFGDKYTVIPTGNCTSVENSVEACNLHAATYSIQTAIGIIDSDLKSDEAINRLKDRKIYTLKCNEIEMLLLDEIIFKRVLRQVYKSEQKFDEFKNAFFAKISERKEYIIKRLVKTQIDEKLRSSIIDDKTNNTREKMKENLESIFDSLDVDVLWDDSDKMLSKIIAERDYDEALHYCCLEHNEVILGVGKPFVTDYSEIALGVLKEDQELAMAIKRKYFPDIEL